MHVRKLPPRANLEQYRKQAKELLAACKAGDERAQTLLHRALGRPGRSQDEPPASFTLANAQFALAREHGFASWPKFVAHLEALNDGDVRLFERAADAVITGDGDALRTLLHERPALAHTRSTREHAATLLHYISANGVEDFRQKSPPNAVAVAKLLLDAGADVDATSNSYGGDWDTTLNLLVSSVHPAKAGVQVPLVHTLLDYGAAINGVADDESPLITALAFHYPDAAEALVRRGARVGTIATAAALGREDLVKQYLTADGNLAPGVPLIAIGWVRIPRTARANVALALVWAGMFGRATVAEILLRSGVDPAARDNRNWTGLHWAAFYRHLETVDVFLEWNAPLELENEFGGTVLDQTVWAAAHSDEPDQFAPVIERLCAAGARTQPVRYPTGMPVIDEILRRHGARAP